MGLFDFIKKKDPSVYPSAFNALPPATNMQALLERYGGIALERQESALEAVANLSWSLNLESAQLQFGNDYLYPIQLIGSFSHATGTWLWSWANEQIYPAPIAMTLVQEIRGYGTANQIAELSNPLFEAPEEIAHWMGMISVGLGNRRFYNLCPYEGGVALVVIDVLPDAAPAPEKVLTVFPQLISQYRLDHRNALICYLLAKGFAVSAKPNQLTASYGKTTLQAEFDAQGRLASLRGALTK